MEKSKRSLNRFVIIFSEKFQMALLPCKSTITIRNHQAGRDVLFTKKQQNDNLATKVSSLK
jgi:hypothetical protein